nr:flavin reductase family protein [Nocardioides convexus]
MVSVSVARTSKTWPDLRRARHFGVTVLADHHGSVCRQALRAGGRALRRRRGEHQRGRRGDPRRGPGPLRLHAVPRGRGR